MLAQALQHAQLAVQLDMTGSDMFAAVTAYDETIELLDRVIARRAHKSGTKADVERVTDIVSSRPSNYSLLVRQEKERMAHTLSLLLLFLATAESLPFSYCDVHIFFFFSMTGIRTVYVSFV